MQQLWVEPSVRRKGIGTELVHVFEEHARGRGCTCLYLETFSFQAPALYRSIGYQVDYERKGYPQGIVKFHMSKRLHEQPSAAPGSS